LRDTEATGDCLSSSVLRGWERNADLISGKTDRDRVPETVQALQATLLKLRRSGVSMGELADALYVVYADILAGHDVSQCLKPHMKKAQADGRVKGPRKKRPRKPRKEASRKSAKGPR